MKLVNGVLLLALGYAAGAFQAAQPPQRSAAQEVNDKHMKEWMERIKGRENEPSEKVFKNIQILKGTPAGRLLRVMNGGYSAALGVECTHCHVENDYASDDKRPKLATHEMAALHRSINEQLAKMQHLESPPPNRSINCSTCHRGSVDPMAAR